MGHSAWLDNELAFPVKGQGARVGAGGSSQCPAVVVAVQASVGRYDEAIALHEQTLTDQKRVLGPDHPDTLNSGNNLANGYYTVGRYDEAIALLEQTPADRERVLGPDHPDTLTSRNNLAATRAQDRRRRWPWQSAS